MLRFIQGVAGVDYNYIVLCTFDDYNNYIYGVRQRNNTIYDAARRVMTEIRCNNPHLKPSHMPRKYSDIFPIGDIDNVTDSVKNASKWIPTADELKEAEKFFM